MSGPGKLEFSGSRRRLLEFAGLAMGGAVLAAGCGSSSSRSGHARSPILAADVQSLNRLLDLEHLAIAAYTAGTPLLPRSAARTASWFLGQELSHAGELSGLVKQAGGKPHQPRSSYDLGHPTSSHDVLILLHAVERAQLAAYIETIPRLTGTKTRAAAAAIFANDAQHIAVLRSELGQPPAPAAFVTGRE